MDAFRTPFTDGSCGVDRKVSFCELAPLKIHRPTEWRRKMKARPAGEMSGEKYTRYRDWREYTKGTHARSPNTSMKPKPSVVMSIVVRMQDCVEKGRGRALTGA